MRLGVLFFFLFCHATLEASQCSSYFWNKEVIVRALKGLHEKDIAINAGALARDTSAATKQAMKQILGREASGAALHRVTLKHFGKYPAALAEAGIKLNDIAKYSKFSKELIVKALRALWKEKVSLHPRTLSADFSQKTKGIIKTETNLNATGALLVLKVRRFFRSFSEALIEAGIDPTTQSVRYNRQVSLAALAQDWVEDDRVRYVSHQPGPYEALRFDELMDILIACANRLSTDEESDALGNLEKALGGEPIPAGVQGFFRECLKATQLDY